MKANWQKYLDINAPRYTSFPSALFFDQRVDERVYADALSKIEPYEPISLYIHVPFCKQLCWYCGCNLVVENRYERAQKYVDGLIAEITQVAKALEGRGEVVNIHFGGGTPNYLRLQDLKRLMDHIELNLGLTDKAHIAMEVDPRLCEEGTIRQLTQLGINRFSIGVQDFDLNVQRAINRVQPYDLVERCVEEMRSYGQSDISFDLLYGLPCQTEQTFYDTLEKTFTLSPDRISLFGYAHLPSKLKHQKLIKDEDLPGKLTRYELAAMAEEYLLKHGYQSIGFDHFAKPDNPLAVAAAKGKLKRNFQGFTDDIAENLIGLGASSISAVKGIYAQNAKKTDAYLDKVSSGQFAVEKGWIKTLEDEVWGRIISDLLCFRRAKVYDHLHDASCTDDLVIDKTQNLLSPLVHDGLVEWQQGELVVSEDARHFSRVIACTLDPYMQRNSYSLSQGV